MREFFRGRAGRVDRGGGGGGRGMESAREAGGWKRILTSVGIETSCFIRVRVEKNKANVGKKDEEGVRK